MRNFAQGQGMREFQPQAPRSKCPWGEYIEVFRGLKFEHDAEIGQNGRLWMGT
jgi:hypothetical protein